MGLADTAQRVSELIRFTDKQMTAFLALWTHRYVLFGGARGGGKSRWLRWSLLMLLIYWAKQGIHNVMVGLFCHTYPELRDRQISKIAQEFPAWLGEIKETKESGLGFYLKPEYGGGIIALRNLDDPEKYKSSEFAAIGVDELTLILKDVFDVLRGSLRWPGIQHTVFMGATNPDGVGNLWVRELWVEKLFPPEMQAIAPQFTFIQALPSDNPHLDPQYWEDLNSQPDDIRKAWVEGDWYVFKGQAFGQFRRDRHVVEPFEIPAHWVRVRGLDWGSNAPLCCLWGARNPDNGRWVVYRELYQTDLEDRQAAQTILTMTPSNENISITYADPSLWGEKQKGVATSATVYSQNGLYCVKADNNRLDGKRRIGRLLSDLPDGKPGLLIFEACTNLARTLPALVYDKVHIEDVDTHGEDHAYDALRYMTSGTSEHREQRPHTRQPSAYERLFK